MLCSFGVLVPRGAVNAEFGPVQACAVASGPLAPCLRSEVGAAAAVCGPLGACRCSLKEAACHRPGTGRRCGPALMHLPARRRASASAARCRPVTCSVLRHRQAHPRDDAQTWLGWARERAFTYPVLRHRRARPRDDAQTWLGWFRGRASMPRIQIPLQLLWVAWQLLPRSRLPALELLRLGHWA